MYILDATISERPVIKLSRLGKVECDDSRVV